MITEKDLLKWGFEKCGEGGYELVLEQHEGWYDYSVYFNLPDGRLVVNYHHAFLELNAVTTKRKADQALRLLGLPPIDKLNEIKK